MLPARFRAHGGATLLGNCELLVMGLFYAERTLGAKHRRSILNSNVRGALPKC